MSLPPDSSIYSRVPLTSIGATPRPSKLNAQYQGTAFDRLHNRSSKLAARVEASTQGRVIPDEDDLAIGEGKHYDRLAILFLDICKFSDLPNWDTSEQKSVLKTLNIFMSEMLSVVRDYEGIFEKNTGDGIMAYFGEGASTDAEAVKPAIDAAIAMHYINDNLIPYFLKKEGCQPITFRVGIDVGPVTLGRVAIHGGSHGSIVAVGTTANVACKLMRLIPNGGVCVGEKAYKALPDKLKQECTIASGNTGHVYRVSNLAYPGWILNYRAPWIDFS